MDNSQSVKGQDISIGPAGPYMVYSAGGLFMQDELTTNVLLKEAVWRLSKGKYEFFLPQSFELQQIDQPDMESFIRNKDLLNVLKSDIVLVRFDGLELESGTVVEFVFAKSLGKPTVILRCDFRRQSGTDRSEPYNLMAMNWPRTISVHLDSFRLWAEILSAERQAIGDWDNFQDNLRAEHSTIQKSVDQIAVNVIAAMDQAIDMDSPFPPDFQELVYRASRYSPGSGFEEMLPEDELEAIIQNLRQNGTL